MKFSAVLTLLMWYLSSLMLRKISHPYPAKAYAKKHSRGVDCKCLFPLAWKVYESLFCLFHLHIRLPNFGPENYRLANFNVHCIGSFSSFHWVSRSSGSVNRRPQQEQICNRMCCSDNRKCNYWGTSLFTQEVSCPWNIEWLSQYQATFTSYRENGRIIKFVRVQSHAQLFPLPWWLAGATMSKRCFRHDGNGWLVCLASSSFS